jgi:hypothetical protein
MLEFICYQVHQGHFVVVIDLQLAVFKNVEAGVFVEDSKQVANVIFILFVVNFDLFDHAQFVFDCD